MKTTRPQPDGKGAITFRVMSLERSRAERFLNRSTSASKRLVTWERDGYLGDGFVRTGATLTEVLMSLMIMSIGVVSVATLFPISAMRTLEANKQTNSTFTRINAEAAIDTFVDALGRPVLLHNPDGDFTYPGAPAGVTDSTPYNSSSSITTPPQPTFRGRTYLVDPIGWQGFNDDPAATAPNIPFPLPSPFSAFPPALNATRDYFGNTAPTAVNWPLPRRYVGAAAFTGFANPYPTTTAQLLAARLRAMTVATQPDNWKLVVESQVTATSTSTVGGVTGITGVTLDNDADLSSINLAAGNAVYRVVIFDIDGANSEIRALYNVSAGTFTVDWVPGAPAQPQLLPPRFDVSPATGATPNVGKVRIEVADQIYTWMLSVRKRPTGPANVDVVVFFKRNFDPLKEQVFDAEFRKWNLGANGVPGAAGDDNLNGTPNEVSEIGFPNTDDTPNATVTLKFSSAATDDNRPHPRRGGYIFDTRNGLWYRIRAIQNEQYGVGASTNEDWIDVVLDETIKLDSTEDLNGNGILDAALGEDSNGNAATVTVPEHGGAIVHPNVVNVFPLEIKEP